MFLLDTNVLSEPSKPAPNVKVMKWLAHMDEDRLFLSAVSIAEIKRGIVLLDGEKKKEKLTSWLAKDLLVRFDKRIIYVDEPIALAWGDAMGLAKKLGQHLSAMDGFIAGTAMAKNLTLVTRNIKDFAFLKLSILNPWEE